jgi:ubiquinone/menaquinone biosynthesis C-methylase UbiE
MAFPGIKQEEERIRATYALRDASCKMLFYAWHRNEFTYSSYRQSFAWARALSRAGFGDLSDIEVLDVGCGNGCWLRMLLEWGAIPSRLHGVDLLKDRIKRARKLSPPDIDFRVNNGWPLPFIDSSMDLCTASTVFSSILDEGARQTLAQEMSRVRKPKGWIMIFDYVISEPRNPDTIGIDRHEIQKLFYQLDLIKIYKLILAPPLLRRFPRNLLWLAHALETFFPFLCTHRLYVLKK